MKVNCEHLLTFAEVAQAGSLSRAAKALNVTQPAISVQMAQLARAVGEPLFTRHRYGVVLTPAGRGLLPHAQAVSRALSGAESYVSSLQGLEVGQVRVAASTTIASYLLPGVVARFRKLHPGLRSVLFVGNTGEVVEQLESGKADLALVEGPVEHLPPGIERQVIWHDELVLVTMPDHPLAGSPREPAELSGLEVIWREQGSGTRAVAEQALADVELVSALELVGTDAVKQAVYEGIGVAFLSRLTVQREVAAGFLAATRVRAPGLVRPLTLLRPKLDLLARAGQVFFELLPSQETDEEAR